MTIEIATYRSPLGEVMMALQDGRVCALAFTDRWPAVERRLAQRVGTAVRRGDGAANSVAAHLDAYFGGEPRALDDVAIDPGGTAFQRAVWTALRRVPAGQTTTYAALARAIGSPRAIRAVGAANAANPIWLIIPCHRAIGSDGRLVGYAGGLERKRWLLEHEGALQPDLLAGRTAQREPMRADQFVGREPD
jgi:methylated-DNA-[protein]-cysteine S-methyltransferase